MTDEQKPLTLADLKEHLSISIDFKDWSYGEALNQIEITIAYDGETITSNTAYIDPAGYIKEDWRD